MALLSGHVAVADDSATIEWNSARRLTWDNFVGSVPARADEKRVATTSASLSWSYEYTLEWSRDSCEFSIESIGSAALFHPDSSWVRAGHRTDAVLLHEQGHFDITKLYQANFDEASRQFVGASRTCVGNSEKRANRFIEDEIARLIGSIYEDIWRQYRLQQEIYDSETRHGMNSDAQAMWTEKFAAQLKARNLL